MTLYTEAFPDEDIDQKDCQLHPAKLSLYWSIYIYILSNAYACLYRRMNCGIFLTAYEAMVVSSSSAVIAQRKTQENIASRNSYEQG